MVLQSFSGTKKWPSFAIALIKPVNIILFLQHWTLLVRPRHRELTVSLRQFTGLSRIYLLLICFIFSKMLWPGGCIDDSWTTALLHPMLKIPGIVPVTELHTVVLQNMCLKWFTAILVLQLQDLVLAVAPLQQKGCVKRRFIIIFDHLWDAFGSWHCMSGGLFCFIGFSKAYDSITHFCYITPFTLMGLPWNILPFCYCGSKPKSPCFSFLYGEVERDTRIHPTHGHLRTYPCS